MAYPSNPTQTFKPENVIVRTHQRAQNTLLSFITLSLILLR